MQSPGSSISVRIILDDDEHLSHGLWLRSRRSAGRRICGADEPLKGVALLGNILIMLLFCRGVPVFVKQLGAKPFHIARAVRTANLLNWFHECAGSGCGAQPARPVRRQRGALQGPPESGDGFAQFCRRNFHRGGLLGGPCHKPLPLPKNFVLCQTFLQTSPLQFRKVYCMRVQFRKGNLR
jgi:hypothetical protein